MVWIPNRVAVRLQDPLSRNADALVLASIATSGLGLVFWVAAARLYPPASVGVGAALVSAMGFVANAATLGLRVSLVRFLPQAGSAAGRLIERTYVVCGLTSLVLGAGFLLAQPLWGGKVAATGGSPGAVALLCVLFAVSSVTWVLFVLQDSVLTGLREAAFVPLKNVIYAVAKLGLLFVLVAVPDWSILIAWTVPALVLLVPFHRVTMTRLLPRRATAADASTVRVSDLARFSAGEHTATVLGLVGTNLLPLVVLAIRSPEESAYYFLAATIADTLAVVTSNVSSAFLAEVSAQPGRVSELLRKGLMHAAWLVIPLTVLGVALAGPLLTVLGPQYAANGTLIFRLLIAGAIPQILIGMAIGLARLRRKTYITILANGFPSLVLVVAGLVGLESFGVVILGYASLAVQVVLALALLPMVVRALRQPRVS